MTLQELAERYDHFLVDQFGVLHDGLTPYPGAVEALVRLKEAGKTVVLLSNSGRRSIPNEERMLGLGFEPGSWDYFLTSGEVAWRRFAGRAGKPALAAGTRCLLMSRGNDLSAVEGLDLELVSRGEDAEIVLLTGSEGDLFPMSHYRRLLEPAASAGTPLVCTNPDKIMLTKAGTSFGAGQIAELYEEMGGHVSWIGKPYPEIYRAALDLLGNPTQERVIGIGDSVEHDIAGARRAGLDAALVCSGILSGMAAGDLEALFEAHEARPNHMLDRFAWR